MKQSKLFIPTLRETPADIQSDSYQLLIKGGFIRQAASGFYSYLPLAVYVLNKIKAIIQEELKAVDAIEVMTPHVVSTDLLQQTERKDLFKNDLFSFVDHEKREYALVPTSEEVLAHLIFSEGQSYKRFPYHLYQIQAKFRDESKIRHGLIRSREFLMADAYSFHGTLEDLNQSYFSYERIFQQIFEKCRVSFVSVIGDSGIMGGKESKEFIAVSNIGDETIVQSSKGDYVSDYTLAKNFKEEKKSHEMKEKMVQLPLSKKGAKKQLKEIAEKHQKLKVYSYVINEAPMYFLLPEAREINETKVKQYFDTKKVTEDKNLLSAFFNQLEHEEKPGVYIEESLSQLVNNYLIDEEKNELFYNINMEDFIIFGESDFQYVKEEDLAPDGKSQLTFKTGVEIGHIFKIGDYYSKYLGGSYVDESEKKQDILMGSYGIGISRLLQVIIEQHHDKKGITWPKAVSPFDLHVIPVNLNDDSQQSLLAEVEEQLKQTNYSYLVDDRNEHIGVKFADADLIGCVLRIIIGKKASEGILEVSLRQSGEKVEVKKEDLISILPILYDSAF